MSSNSTSNEFAGFGMTEQPVFGARSFNVNRDGMLTGVTFPQVWEMGVNEARCWKTEPSLNYSFCYYEVDEEQPPAPPRPQEIDECFHGFHAFYDGSSDYRHMVRVEGVVKGTGKTVVGPRGFRTMRAQIVALHIPGALPEARADAVRLNYWAVPLFDSFESMVSAFPPDIGEITKRGSN